MAYTVMAVWTWVDRSENVQNVSRQSMGVDVRMDMHGRSIAVWTLDDGWGAMDPGRPYRYGLYSYGLCSYGLYRYGLYSCGLGSYELHSHGL